MKNRFSYFKLHFTEISAYFVCAGLAFGYPFHITIFETPFLFTLLFFSLIGIACTLGKLLGVYENSNYEDNAKIDEINISKNNNQLHDISTNGNLTNSLRTHPKERKMNE